MNIDNKKLDQLADMVVALGGNKEAVKELLNKITQTTLVAAMEQAASLADSISVREENDGDLNSAAALLAFAETVRGTNDRYMKEVGMPASLVAEGRKKAADNRAASITQIEDRDSDWNISDWTKN